jgi:hypothetical protein
LAFNAEDAIGTRWLFYNKQTQILTVFPTYF